MDIVNGAIQEYAERFTSDESPVLRELREKTYSERSDKNMLSGFYQGRVLSFISKLVRPKLVVEVGTYMGYSAICLAEGLRDEGKVITFDVNEETNAIARSFWDKAGVTDKIDDRLGQAIDLIPNIEEEIDLAFIDADKENYSNYYEQLLPKMRRGGLIVADNVLWSGDVLNVESGTTTKTSSKALHEYNERISSDESVESLLFAVRDGLMIARKK